jgi:2-succinyl-5-enolpyruvyl-6-hydroxy-3-cyclohexene-1-carboxylate synthase
MRAADANEAFALVVVDELVRHGITEAVLAPGSRSTPLALVLARDDRIRLHVRIDERSASFTAIGLARVSGRPVPILCTSGTAAAEFHAAVLEADQARVPLLVLTADRPPELRGVGANQTLDQIKLYGGAVRWFHEVGVPEERADSVRYWRSTISEAVAAARGVGGAPGPVHLNLPLREPLVPTGDGYRFSLDGRAAGRPWTASISARRALPDDAAALLAAATTGVVLAGDGLDAAGVDGVLALAAARGWPVVAEPHSNARRGPNALGPTDAVLRDSAFRAAHVPDVVVVAGRVGLSRAVTEWLTAVAPATEVVLVDRHGAWWDPTRTTATVVAADPAALADITGPSAPSQWLSDWQHAATAAQRAVDEVLAAAGLTEPRIARDLAAALPDGALLAVASSMPIRDVDLTMRPRDGVRIVANRGVSGIDGFMSTAVGAALGHDGPSYALAGDLSALHDINGLLADPAPDLTVVVINNDGGGIFSLLPQAGGDAVTFERVFGTPHGVALADVARGYGVGHIEVADLASFDEQVRTPPKGLRIVEVRTDRRANADLHRRLTEVAAAAVSAAATP